MADTIIIPFYKQFTGKTSIPEPVAVAGTFLSTGSRILIADGANDVVEGDYVYSTTLNEAKKVLSVTDNIVQLASPFSANITVAEALKIVGRNKFQYISVSNEGSGTGVFNGNDFKRGKFLTFVNVNEDDARMSPIIIDATGTLMCVAGAITE